MTRHLPRKAVVAGCATVLLLGLGAPQAGAAPDPDDAPSETAPSETAPSETAPSAPAPSGAERAAAHRAARAPENLDTLSRFFAREGAVTAAEAEPRVLGEAVPVYFLAPDFVAGKKNSPVARLEFLASRAVSADGQEASLWTVPKGDTWKKGGTWKVVNIATGDDETHYARAGAEKLPGGTVFHEPQINAWYVTRHARVLPLDRDATRAVGADGTSLSAYRKRVERAYGDKLPGSAYARSGKAGGYAERPAAPGPRLAATERQGGSGVGPALTVASAAAGLGAAGALALGAVRTVRKRREATRG
ncbi:hypothetical protein [Streptomyces boluensis]|uniref:Uncharacterized protein n=1 Tax=Streptomyces boluensis TaxID=1775135 RepID=A0A964URC0_9ACTN|nr:hypothetical protein [Streptomyces boluensis]NBE54018.1 hypothetical protein [Streptomyces boluensis]